MKLMVTLTLTLIGNERIFYVEFKLSKVEFPVRTKCFRSLTCNFISTVYSI